MKHGKAMGRRHDGIVKLFVFIHAAQAAAIMMAIVMVFIIGLLFLTENYFGKDVEG